MCNFLTRTLLLQTGDLAVLSTLEKLTEHTCSALQIEGEERQILMVRGANLTCLRLRQFPFACKWHTLSQTLPHILNT